MAWAIVGLAAALIAVVGAAWLGGRLAGPPADGATRLLLGSLTVSCAGLFVAMLLPLTKTDGSVASMLGEDGVPSLLRVVLGALMVLPLVAGAGVVASVRRARAPGALAPTCFQLLAALGIMSQGGPSDALEDAPRSLLAIVPWLGLLVARGAHAQSPTPRREGDPFGMRLEAGPALFIGGVPETDSDVGRVIWIPALTLGAAFGGRVGPLLVGFGARHVVTLVPIAEIDGLLGVVGRPGPASNLELWARFDGGLFFPFDSSRTGARLMPAGRLALGISRDVEKNGGVGSALGAEAWFEVIDGFAPGGGVSFVDRFGRGP